MIKIKEVICTKFHNTYTNPLSMLPYENILFVNRERYQFTFSCLTFHSVSKTVVRYCINLSQCIEIISITSTTNKDTVDIFFTKIEKKLT